MNTIRLLFVWLAGLCVALAQERPAPAHPTITVGAVISQTGAHAELAADYLKGLQLWREQMNEAGGLLGRRVELRVLDDNSRRAARARALRGAAARPQGRPADRPLRLGRHAACRRRGRARSPRDGEWRRAGSRGAQPAGAVSSSRPRCPTPRTALACCAVAETAELRRLFILARDDAASREMAEATRNTALKRLRARRSRALSPRHRRLRRAGGEGARREGRGVDRLRRRARRRRDGQDLQAPGLRAAAVFRRRAPRTRASSRCSARTRSSASGWSISIRASATRKRARSRRRSPPGGPCRRSSPRPRATRRAWCSRAAVRSAGNLDQERLRAALAELELPTVLGEYRVAPENGAQIGFRPAVVQIRKGRPEAGTPLLPYPQWNERALIKMNRSFLFAPGNVRAPRREGAHPRRGRGDRRSRGLGRDRRKGGDAKGRRRRARAPAAPARLRARERARRALSASET